MSFIKRGNPGIGGGGLPSTEVNQQAGNYTAVLDDQTVEFTAGPFEFSWPLNATLSIPIGRIIIVRSVDGIGDITLKRLGSQVYRSVLGNVDCKLFGGDGNPVQIEKTGTDAFLISGPIKAV
jgi:hypothetical protein